MGCKTRRKIGEGFFVSESASLCYYASVFFVDYSMDQENQGKMKIFVAVGAIVVVLMIAGIVMAIRSGRTGFGNTVADPTRGAADAKVVIIEYSDFQCPFCAKVQPKLDALMKLYGDQVRLEFNDFPLQIHPNAIPAAYAASCANEQGKFWPYHDMLYGRQSEWSTLPDPTDTFVRYLGSMEGAVDKEQFRSCYTSKKYLSSIQEDMKEGESLNIKGTPTFFVNGERIVGDVDLLAKRVAELLTAK